MKCNVGISYVPYKVTKLPYLQHQYQFSFVLIIQIVTCALHEEWKINH